MTVRAEAAARRAPRSSVVVAPVPPQQTWVSPPQGEPAVSVHDPAVQVPETPVPLQA